MSEDSGAAPPPYVLDLSVSAAVARFDASVMTLIQAYDARGQALVLPVLALTGASLDARTEDGDDLLEGLEGLGNAEVAPLRDAEQAARLAAVMLAAGKSARQLGARRTREPVPAPQAGSCTGEKGTPEIAVAESTAARSCCTDQYPG